VERSAVSLLISTQALEAIDWTVYERGLAGLSDLEGIPWTMPMEQFFEAWVETVMRSVAHQMGGTLKAGLRRETVSPLAWDPPYTGSQRSVMFSLFRVARNSSALRAVSILLRFRQHGAHFITPQHRHERRARCKLL
jgi:hypothetical protein